MQRYVVGFAVSDAHLVALVRKNRPEWQAGHLNGIGGKCRDGEPAGQAMLREWHEETDGAALPWGWRHFALQHGEGFAVDYFLCRVPQLPKLPAVNDVGEVFEFRYIKDLLAGAVPCIRNVPWLLSAIMSDPAISFIDISDGLEWTKGAS